MLRFTIFISFCLILFSCKQLEVDADFDIQGHRGFRGLMPENSIEGFLKAVDIGVNTIELDVVITADEKVLVSHEAYINPKICYDPFGKDIPEDQSKDLNIYKLTYREVALYDCGSKVVKEFPQQKKMRITKPLLKDVIIEVESHLANKGINESVRYNIELKSSGGFDNIYHPEPAKFVDLVMSVVNEKMVYERVCIQSFDTRILQRLNSRYPYICNALLIDSGEDYKEKLQQLQHTPVILSPYYKLVDNEMVNYCHDNEMRIIPWTVNEKTEMIRLIKMNVDGIISDYPDRLMKITGISPQAGK